MSGAARDLSQASKVLNLTLFARGCMSEREIEDEIKDINQLIPNAFGGREAEDIITEMKEKILFMGADLIEYSSPIDDVNYYGVGWNIPHDDIADHSMQQLSKPATHLFKYLFFTALKNKGLFDRQTITAVNSNLQKSLSLQDLSETIAYLERTRFIEIIPPQLQSPKKKRSANQNRRNRLSAADSAAAAPIDADADGDADMAKRSQSNSNSNIYTLGARSYIEFQHIIEANDNNDENGSECVYCQSTVAVKGHTCSNERCSNVLHLHCAEQHYGASDWQNVGCPACTLAWGNGRETFNKHCGLIADPTDAVSFVESVFANRSPSELSPSAASASASALSGFSASAAAAASNNIHSDSD